MPGDRTMLKASHKLEMSCNVSCCGTGHKEAACSSFPTHQSL